MSNVDDASGPPDFFVSDPALLDQAAYQIRERQPGEPAVDPAQRPPYFIELSDGRYAYGYANAEGWTTPLYAAKELPHRVYWEDEALAKWFAHQKKPQ